MKTKTKFLTGFLLLFFFPFCLQAKWYTSGIAGTAPNVASRNMNCTADLYPDAVGPTIAAGTGPAGDWGFQYTQGQVQVLASGQCQWWDSTLPTNSSFNYPDSWTNNTNITLSWVNSDFGGAGYKNTDIRVYRGSSQGTPTSLITTLSNVTGTNYVYAGSDGYSYKFEICARDNADNICSSWVTSPNVTRVDTTAPAPSGLTDSTTQNLLATTSQNFNLSFNDGGAPVRVDYRFERNGSSGVFDSLSSAYSYNYNYTRDISNVDINRQSNGGRLITIYIDRVCDQAGNCSGTVGGPAQKTITHTIYANPNVTNAASNIQDATELGNAIADGQARRFLHTIRDAYGNAIIPATGIGRTVSLQLSNIINTMYLDQYSRSGNTSLFIDTNTTALTFSSNQSLGSRASTTGEYVLPVFVYTPTANAYSAGDPVSDPLAQFGFTSNLAVNDSLGISKTFTQTLSNPAFRPLYRASISGNLRDGGFIEGTEQESSITITSTNPSISVLNPKLQSEFSGSNAGNFVLRSIVPGPLSIGNTRTDIQTSFSTISPFTTKLIQNGGVSIQNVSNIQLSTHFSYVLDGKTILYNADIIGKTGGYFGTIQNLGNQVSVKVIGPIAGNAIQAITTGQFDNSTSIFGGVSRTEVRNTMKQSIALATRNMQLQSVGDTILDIAGLPSGSNARGFLLVKDSNTSLMKIEKVGGDILLGLNTNTSFGVSGKRTLVIRGANLYIKSNMYYMDTNSILGVVVQKDEAGNGGNLYIDPSVTNVIGNYILDGSVMSYNGTEIGAGNITTLKNQLYIYGSILSENTIGGSKMSPARCPTLLASCPAPENYDLNYLRRYYLYNSNPFGGAKVIGGGTCTSGVCSGFASGLVYKFTSTSDDLAKYPLIIEYNPLIRMTPPLGFETVQD